MLSCLQDENAPDHLLLSVSSWGSRSSGPLSQLFSQDAVSVPGESLKQRQGYVQPIVDGFGANQTQASIIPGPDRVVHARPNVGSAPSLSTALLSRPPPEPFEQDPVRATILGGIGATVDGWRRQYQFRTGRSDRHLRARHPQVTFGNLFGTGDRPVRRPPVDQGIPRTSLVGFGASSTSIFQCSVRGDHRGLRQEAERRRHHRREPITSP